MTTFTRLGFGLAATAVSISAPAGRSKIDDTKAITDAATTAVEQLGDTTGGLAEVAVQAIDPNVPAALNQWTYTAGQVPDPPPVDYDDDTEALQQNLFALSEVPATAIVAAVDNAIGASGIADGDVQSVVIKQVRTDKTGLVIDVR